jgi:tetratricopeptide (TPR) repeat protein
VVQPAHLRNRNDLASSHDCARLGSVLRQRIRLGQWESALRESRDGLRLQPNSAVAYFNLALSQLALNQTEDASATLEQALVHKLDAYYLRILRYETAFLRRDQQVMEQQLAWAAGRSGEEDWLLTTQSDTAAYLGRLVQARELSQRAVESARRADAKERAAVLQANAALREVEFGKAASARRHAMAALALFPGKHVRCLAALVLARAGDTTQPQKLAERLNKDFSHNTIVQGYWLPSIRAAIELHANNFTKTIEILHDAEPYEYGQTSILAMMYPVYVRGQAYLLAGHGREAAAEFEKMIEHPGLLLNSPLGALARLGLARAYALQGDTAKARAAYKDFLTLWKDADPDVPILKEAKAEYAKLK